MCQTLIVLCIPVNIWSHRWQEFAPPFCETLDKGEHICLRNNYSNNTKTPLLELSYLCSFGISLHFFCVVDVLMIVAWWSDATSSDEAAEEGKARPVQTKQLHTSSAAKDQVPHSKTSRGQTVQLYALKHFALGAKLSQLWKSMKACIYENKESNAESHSS